VAVSTVLTPDQLHEIQALLPERVAIISTYVNRSGVSAWVMTKSNLVHVPAKIGWGDYRRAVKELRLALTDPFQDYYREPARRLYDEFFAPIATALGPEITVIVHSPDELFARIPLTALHDGEQFLVQRYAVHRIPSLRFLAPEKHLGQYRPARGIGCVDPDIEGARLPRQAETGEYLHDLWGKSFTLLSGSTCSPRMLENAIGVDDRPAFLHVGAHGTFYSPDPMHSGIALSTDQTGSRSAFWNARAMGAVDLSRLELVTLSSCETGIADPKTPRDVFGIQRALFFGGVENMVAPLWSVYDQPTAQLMRSFYTELRGSGRLAESLRAAQLELIRDRELSHPHFWSGFILSGGPA
jgi:CHAT domain-containing protein